MNNVALNFLTDDQVRELFRKEIRSVLSSYLEEKKSEESESRVVDLDGLIKARPFVGSRSTIYKKVSRGEIPHAKNGKRLIFDLNTIDEWLLSNRIKSSEEIEEESLRYFKRRNRKGRRKTSL